jgi:hypothetical protein
MLFIRLKRKSLKLFIEKHTNNNQPIELLGIPGGGKSTFVRNNSDHIILIERKKIKININTVYLAMIFMMKFYRVIFTLPVSSLFFCTKILFKIFYSIEVHQKNKNDLYPTFIDEGYFQALIHISIKYDIKLQHKLVHLLYLCTKNQINNFIVLNIPCKVAIMRCLEREKGIPKMIISKKNIITCFEEIDSNLKTIVSVLRIYDLIGLNVCE